MPSDEWTPSTKFRRNQSEHVVRHWRSRTPFGAAGFCSAVDVSTVITSFVMKPSELTPCTLVFYTEDGGSELLRKHVSVTPYFIQPRYNLVIIIRGTNWRTSGVSVRKQRQLESEIAWLQETVG